MRLFKDAKGYATEELAIKKLVRTLATIDLTTSDVHWAIVVNSYGRFVPVIRLGSQTQLIQLAHVGIGVM